MADWVTISALATASGTLVLAAATFASVRSANRAARVAEQAFLMGQRPLVMPSRLDDPPEKLMWGDEHWAHVEGSRGSVEVVDGNVYLAIVLAKRGQRHRGPAGVAGQAQATRARPAGVRPRDVPTAAPRPLRARGQRRLLAGGDPRRVRSGSRAGSSSISRAAPSSHASKPARSGLPRRLPHLPPDRPPPDNGVLNRRRRSGSWAVRAGATTPAGPRGPHPTGDGTTPTTQLARLAALRDQPGLCRTSRP